MNIQELQLYRQKMGFVELSETKVRFFRQLEKAMGEEQILLYGSVLRRDYADGLSDIDVMVFSEQPDFAAKRAAALFRQPYQEIHKIVWKLNKEWLYGYKVKVGRDDVLKMGRGCCGQQELQGREELSSLKIEVAIYNEVFRDRLMEEMYRPIQRGGPVSDMCLLALKVFYYYLPILPKGVYIVLKQHILNRMIPGKPESVYIDLAKESDEEKQEQKV